MLWPVMLIVGLWLAFQAAFVNTFVFHDGWKHGFPMFFSVARHTTCGGLPNWIFGVDSGSPLVVQVISTSLTQLVRLPAVYAAGCLRLGLVPALYLYKAQLIFGYLLFAAAMYVLGRLLFERRASALYLFVATLYAGLFLDVSHSAQVLAIVFWIPWIFIAAVWLHRQAGSARAPLYASVLVLLLSLQALDQYPHFVVLTVGVAAALYAALWPQRLRTLAQMRVVRLGPAVLIVVITAFQLWTIRQTIADYQPSLRASLMVDPKTFHETGFVQLTALIGSFFPLGFLAGFDDLGNVLLHQIPEEAWLRPLLWVDGVSRAFIFRLDELLFYLGFVPLVLLALFALRRSARRQRAWWFAFGGILFLVSLQHSGIYLLTLKLPFFTIFRSYFLYVVIVVFALLVMSGYGMDAYLTLGRDDRRRLLLRALGLVLAATMLAGTAMTWLLLGVSPRTAVWTLRYIALDAMLIVLGVVNVIYAARARTPERGAGALIATVVASGAAFFVVAQTLIGIPRSEVIERYHLDDADRTSVTANGAVSPSFTRKECQVYAECYAALRDTASLRRDLDGTFLRHRRDPVFQPGLDPAVVRALSGITHPVIWLSAEVVPYGDRKELIARLNGHARDISAHLARAAYVSRRTVAYLRVRPVQARGADGDSKVIAVQRGRDLVRVFYRADAPAYLNLAIAHDQHWRATINGLPASVARGNLNGLLVPVPAGAGEVTLHYRSTASDLFFCTRYAALVAGLLAVAWLTPITLARRTDGASKGNSAAASAHDEPAGGGRDR